MTADLIMGKKALFSAWLVLGTLIGVCFAVFSRNLDGREASPPSISQWESRH